MMARKWIPLPHGGGEGVVVVDGQLALLTLAGQWNLDVDFHPKWCCDKVIAYMPISTFTDDPDGWKSEFRGDGPPERSGWYIVTVERSSGRHALERSYYDASKGRWCREDRIGEVLAYMEMPKPCKARVMI